MKLRIDEPCDARWDQMKVGVRSRFCNQCQKGVTDFTQYSRTEILQYLLQHQGQNVCGRFRKSQLNFHDEELMVTIRAISREPGRTNTAFYLLAVTSLFLSSCANPNPTSTSPSAQSVEVHGQTQTPLDTTQPPTAAQDSTFKDSTQAVNTGGSNYQPTPIDPINPTAASASCATAPVINDTTDEWIMGDVEIITMGEVALPYDTVPTGTHDEDSNYVYEFVDKMPEFTGGMDSLFAFLQREIRYPELERNAGVEGKVFVQFVVLQNGELERFEVVRSPSKSFEKEVLRVMNLMPKWTPGEHQGVPVNVRFILPVSFKLD